MTDEMTPDDARGLLRQIREGLEHGGPEAEGHRELALSRLRAHGRGFAEVLSVSEISSMTGLGADEIFALL